MLTFEYVNDKKKNKMKEIENKISRATKRSNCYAVRPTYYYLLRSLGREHANNNCIMTSSCLREKSYLTKELTRQEEVNDSNTGKRTAFDSLVKEQQCNHI